MRSPIMLAAIAPLALLAACGRTTPADQTEALPMDNEVAKLEMAAEPLPEVPENALDRIDFAGTYTREDSEGTERLTLDSAANTYEYTAPDGTTSSGSFIRLEDNRRIEIEDLDGEPGYFAIADGAVFRLGDADTSPDQITVTGQYRRDTSFGTRQNDAAAPATGDTDAPTAPPSPEVAADPAAETPPAPGT